MLPVNCPGLALPRAAYGCPSIALALPCRVPRLAGRRSVDKLLATEARLVSLSLYALVQKLADCDE